MLITRAAMLIFRHAVDTASYVLPRDCHAIIAIHAGASMLLAMFDAA